jgi:hypothetical protein
MREEWKRHESSAAQFFTALDAVLAALEAMQHGPEGQNLTRGLAEGPAHLIRTLVAYQADLTGLLEGCETAKDGTHAAKIARLWQKYEGSLRDLLLRVEHPLDD